ncbi:hypothetical protein Pyn_35818 [Prunus yedoensis var. nudiflora]|uniref:Uncharacterized protein n=1 Tax=Prunus yedoensis var. nudiflora TaxID=2094558 RepID=A0A314UW03_PRUYE|nr:hypothetical protein Pyn_35818 [Prunus yedoensis var. nudiflora]
MVRRSNVGSYWAFLGLTEVSPLQQCTLIMGLAQKQKSHLRENGINRNKYYDPKATSLQKESETPLSVGRRKASPPGLQQAILTRYVLKEL